MEHKFKVGDRVRRIEGSSVINGLEPGTVATVSKVGIYQRDEWLALSEYPDREPKVPDGLPYHVDQFELVKSELVSTSPQQINFILQYDLDTDPFETFSTLTEVKDRIKVLAQRSDLKRDSLKLYHIAKVQSVEISTAIAFISAEEKPAEQVKTKSKAKQPCPQCGKKFKRLNSHIVRSHKTL